MLKRAGLSTIRKPARSIILVIILFVMANLLLATVAIRNSVDASMAAAKNKLDATVNLTIDSEKLMAQGGNATSTPKISEELARGISQSGYLKDYTYSLSITANADGFSTVTTAQNEREQQFRDAFTNARNQAAEQTEQLNAAVESFNANSTTETTTTTTGPANTRPEGGGRPPEVSGGDTTTTTTRTRGPRFSFNMSFDIADPSLSTGDTSIVGINAYNFISEVDTGSMTLASGVAFDENSGNGAIISNKVAEANSLAVGDLIRLKTLADSTEVELTILGIYSVTSDDFNFNTIYTNIETAKQFYSAEQLENLSVSNVKYYLASAGDKDAFLAEIAEDYPEVAENSLKLDIDTSGYDTMVGPIEKVGSFATTIMWVVLIAAAVIITLIVVINVKDRRYEMGVLLSLGSRRTGILGQIFLELVIVGTVAFAVSIGTSQIVASQLGDLLMSQESTAEQETAPEAPGRGRMATRSTAQITNVDVSAGLYDYLMLFGLGYLILIVAMIVPSINILRYQPKTILTGKE